MVDSSKGLFLNPKEFPFLIFFVLDSGLHYKRMTAKFSLESTPLGGFSSICVFPYFQIQASELSRTPIQLFGPYLLEISLKLKPLKRRGFMKNLTPFFGF